MTGQEGKGERGGLRRREKVGGKEGRRRGGKGTVEMEIGMLKVGASMVVVAVYSASYSGESLVCLSTKFPHVELAELSCLHVILSTYLTRDISYIGHL